MNKETKLDIIEMSRGYLGAILLMVLMWSGLVTAIYAGESETIILTEEFEYYSIVGNSTIIDLNVTQNNLEVTITPDKYTRNETFTIIFFNKEKEVITITDIIHTGGGGGGGSSTKYIDRIVLEPKFYDRNITKIVEVEKNNTIETITYQETGWKLWHIILALVVGFVICYVLWLIYNNSNKKRSDINEV